MFSVIIPLYNKAPYIEKAIRSVAAQTFQEFELIVIDDGSTDDGIKKVEDLFNLLTPPLGFPPNKGGGWVATHQSNSGVSVARNNGVVLANYPYICFLDADDWWAPTFLEEMKGLIESYPEAGIYGSSYYKVKNGKYIEAKIGVEEGFQQGLINYCQVYAKTMWMPLTSISVVVKKQVFNEFKGFKPQLKLGEDFDLWVRIAIKYPVAFLNKPLAYYNQDVEFNHRAVGRLHNPDTHMLWSIDYLQEEEKINVDLKQLLDNLRTYSLLPYYLSKPYYLVAKKELQKVNWKNQSLQITRQYNTARILLKSQYEFMKIGSKVKQWLLKFK